MLDSWVPVRDGDRRAFEIFKRHYTCLPYRRRPRANGSLFVGPGEKMVLLSPTCDALFVWRRMQPGFDKSGQLGVNCAVFRNEGGRLSSDLILAAERYAWERWPGSRLYTFVNPRRVRSSNPGYCFLAAGWRKCGVTKKRGLIILEKLCYSELT